MVATAALKEELEQRGMKNLVLWSRGVDAKLYRPYPKSFGLVIIEALACGVPVAAYPVRGPLDIIEEGVTGYLNEDLKQAAMQALALDSDKCRESALNIRGQRALNSF